MTTPDDGKWASIGLLICLAWLFVVVPLLWWLG